MSDYLRNADAASPDVDMFGQPGTTKEQMLAVQRGKSVDGTGNARFSVNPNLLSDVARATNTDKASLGINKATAVGLEEGTVSQFKPQADGGNVMTPADLSA